MPVSTSVGNTGSEAPLKRMIYAHRLTAFFVMALGFPWIVLLPLILSRNSSAPGASALPVEPFQILGALVGPTLGAIVVTAVLEGKSGLRNFFARYVQWRADRRWYLLILIGPLIALTLGAIPIVGPDILTNFFQNLPLLLATYLLALVVGIILGPLWEEPGWRGFALPRMQKIFGPLRGSLLLGVLWAVFHLPGFFGGWLGEGGFTANGFAALLVATMAYSVIMTWIFNSTRASILLMILFHSATNAATSVGGLVLPPNMSDSVHSFVYSGWIPALAGVVCALPVAFWTTGRLGYRAGRST
jgi:membrane protease YdiL (CAAX protease family)